MKVSIVTGSKVLNDLKHVDETLKNVSHRYGLSQTTVSSIFHTHVFISRKRLPELLYIDMLKTYRIVSQYQLPNYTISII